MIMALRRQLQRNEILIVVALVVGAQTDKDRQLIVLQLCAVGHKVVGMDEHLQALILAQVEVGVLVDGLRLVLREILHREAQGLLIVLSKLLLIGVGDTGDARRQDVGHRLALGILLDVDGTHLQGARLGTGAGLQVLLILTPLTTHKV